MQAGCPCFLLNPCCNQELPCSRLTAHGLHRVGSQVCEKQSRVSAEQDKRNSKQAQGALAAEKKKCKEAQEALVIKKKKRKEADNALKGMHKKNRVAEDAVAAATHMYQQATQVTA